MNCPVTQIMEIGDSPVDMMVGFSHYDAAFAAISHILGQGYRRIGFSCSCTGDPSAGRLGHRTRMLEAYKHRKSLATDAMISGVFFAWLAFPTFVAA